MNETTETTVEKLQKKYRGIRVSDLNDMNPEYSCVICSKLKTCDKTPRISRNTGNGSIEQVDPDGQPGKGKCCSECEQITEEVFAYRYNFDTE